MTVFLPKVFSVLILYLTCMNSLNVFCIADVLEDETDTIDENVFYLNYLESEEFLGIKNGDAPDLRVPSIAMTDYNPRTFRLKKIQSLSCPELSRETFFVSFKANELVDGIEFYSVNGSLVSTEPTAHIIYDYDQPENNDVTILKRTSRLDNLLTPKGMLKAGFDYFYPEEFFIEKVNNSGLFMKTCKIDCDSGETPCVKICCPLGEVFDALEGNCYYSGQIEWRPTFYSDVYTKLKDADSHRVHFKRIILRCKPDQLNPLAFREIPSSPRVPVKVLSDGTVNYVGPARRWEKVEYPNCVSGMQNYTTNNHSYFTGAEEDQILFLCSPAVQEDRELSYYYVGAMLISSVFLLMTATVYILLWEKQNIHGWTILSFVMSMFLMFVFLSIAHLLGKIGVNKHGGTFYCIANGALAHFFFLSTFCWLSIIHFDIWWTLRCNTPLSERSKGIKRFCMYTFFSWGGPVLVLSVGFTLQHFFPDRESLIMIPEYGVYTCFISVYAQGVYIYYIMSVLMVWNFIFMCLTFYTLYRFRQGTSSVRSTSTHQQNLFCTLVKLLVVMGSTWSLEVVSWYYGDFIRPWWVATDMINVFQAIGIFIIFVCKKQIINQLQAKYQMFKRTGLRPSGSQMTTTTNTRTMSVRTDVQLDGNASIIRKNLPKQYSQNNILVGTKL